ncbi:MAG: hypothetical protein U1F43_26240 [Myxococcota bacterium]
MKIEMTSDVQPAKDSGSTDGFAKWIVVNREVKITITALVTTYSTLNTLGSETGTGLQLDPLHDPGLRRLGLPAELPDCGVRHRRGRIRPGGQEDGHQVPHHDCGDWRKRCEPAIPHRLVLIGDA